MQIFSQYDFPLGFATTTKRFSWLPNLMVGIKQSR